MKRHILANAIDSKICSRYDCSLSSRNADAACHSLPLKIYLTELAL